MMDVSISIVSWNTKEYLKKCLHSIRDNTKDISYEVIVVDNGSSDGTPQMIEEEFPQVRLIKNNQNLGFAKANNQAIRASTGRYVLLLNPDTVILNDALQVLIHFMDSHPQAGACGPKILNPDGTVQQSSVREFPNIKYLFYDSMGLTRAFPRSKIFGRYRMTHWDYSSLREVDQPMGSCLLVRREAIAEVGLLDERFFIFYEDVDWCYRIKKEGWRIFFVPAAKVIHYGGGSGSQFAKETLLENYKSLYKFFRKYHGRLYILLVKLISFWGLFLRIWGIIFLIMIDTFRGKACRGRFWRNCKQMLTAHIAALLRNWRL